MLPWGRSFCCRSLGLQFCQLQQKSISELTAHPLKFLKSHLTWRNDGWNDTAVYYHEPCGCGQHLCCHPATSAQFQLKVWLAIWWVKNTDDIKKWLLLILTSYIVGFFFCRFLSFSTSQRSFLSWKKFLEMRGRVLASRSSLKTRPWGFLCRNHAGFVALLFCRNQCWVLWQHCSDGRPAGSAGYW